jgi:hypothetical protein
LPAYGAPDYKQKHGEKLGILAVRKRKDSIEEEVIYRGEAKLRLSA